MENVSSLLQAYKGLKPSRIPVWFMRQAGRFLPEYRELRSRYSMLEALRTPQVAAEITLQPLKRFDLDAAIIFSDILIPLTGMGIKLDFIEGEGPRIFNPVRSIEDVKRLEVNNASNVMIPTFEAMEIVASTLSPRGIPLLGFTGAPFTLSSYLIEGKGSHNLEQVKQFMFAQPEGWRLLQEKLCVVLYDLLVAQAKAGGAALQLFDSWAGHLGPLQYEDFVAPYLRKLIRDVKRVTGVPVVYFSTGTTGMLPLLKTLGADVLSVDWRISLREADRILQGAVPLQGNLDPLVMAGAWQYLEKQTHRLLQERAELKAHVFNLGHGILPHTPIENVERVIALIRNFER